jgi:hypothetical protein
MGTSPYRFSLLMAEDESKTLQGKGHLSFPMRKLGLRP